MKDIMIDIETLGTRPTSVITQIGACNFDRAEDCIYQVEYCVKCFNLLKGNNNG